MTTAAEITPTELADRLAMRQLVDAYAHCADRRDAGGQRALFTEDAHFLVHMNGQGSEPTQILDGREALTPVFDALNSYQATMHFNGQSTIAFDGDRATGESYCIAHHLFTDDGERKLMVVWLRYGDTFVKVDGNWLFAERNVYVDWTETRQAPSG
jgi:SnoaL-like domain